MGVCISWLGIHRFEPRYDIGAPDISGISLKGYAVPETVQALRPKTYVHDICVKCGAIVKRETSKS